MDIESFKFYSTVFIITLIFTFFAFSISGIFIQEPDYAQYCKDSYYYIYNPTKAPANCSEIDSPTINETIACSEINGQINYRYVAGCPTEYYCETCMNAYEKEASNYRLLNFIITGIIGTALAVISVNYKIKKGKKDWIYASITLSGITILFFSTISYYNELHRFARPIILLAELALIGLIAKKNLK